MDATKLQTILEEIQVSLDTAVGLLPTMGTAEADAKFIAAVNAILVGVFKAYNEHQGQPYDLSLLPNEDLVQ